MQRNVLLLVVLGPLWTLGCGGSHGDHDHGPGDPPHGPNPEQPAPPGEDEHDEEEVPLGMVLIGDVEVELAQGHGAVEAGKEAHLVVKLPYSDDGATVVRAWIGTEDRTLSFVGKGEYAAAHDDYDVHATAPDPLPADPLWWIEVTRPDGEPVVGSVQPILE